MKTCEYCGEKNFDTNSFCSRCGQPIYEKSSSFSTPTMQPFPITTQPQVVLKESGLSIATKVTMVCITAIIASCFATFFVSWITCLIINNNYTTTETTIAVITSLIYMILFFIFGLIALSMTISYFNKIAQRKPIGIGFKICALLFVGVVPGILMLCDTGNGYQYAYPPQPPYIK